MATLQGNAQNRSKICFENRCQQVSCKGEGVRVEVEFGRWLQGEGRKLEGVQ